MEPLTPIDTAPLFPPLSAALVALLRALPPAAWDRPTLAGDWRVRDIVAHLLDIDLRRVSVSRDGHRLIPDRPVASFEELVAWLNTLNATGVAAARRVSPRVLVDLLEISGGWVAELVAALPPDEAATFPVAWAGEAASANWMDVGREYTERWHHQMQIRAAVGAPGLLEHRWLFPLLDLSVRALPRAFAATPAAEGTAVRLDVPDVEGVGVGGAGGVLTWSVVREREGWRVWRGAPASPAATVRLSPNAAWRLFYNALPAADAEHEAAITGDAALARVLFGARSVMV